MNFEDALNEIQHKQIVKVNYPVAMQLIEFFMVGVQQNFKVRVIDDNTYIIIKI